MSAANEIISYLEMCQREGMSLQRGMNYRVGDNHSVFLMSVRSNAPYNDHVEDNGATLIYEGHDVSRRNTDRDPKTVDQPERTKTGKLTPNGRFHQAAQEFKQGKRPPERIRVYEKIRQGIWSYNGLFHLVDSWRERSNGRSVFKFKLHAIAEENTESRSAENDIEQRRLIPSAVKLEVWKRDQGKCTKCGADDNLHFDHIIPFSKGGTSLKAENIQLLCARHNLEKSDRIG